MALAAPHRPVLLILAAFSRYPEAIGWAGQRAEKAWGSVALQSELFDHRIYLGRGIYAENTLYFTRGAWQSRPWTYPDYLRADYHQFFGRCREFLRTRQASYAWCRNTDRTEANEQE